MKIGALTSKPYAFVARPWELKNVMSLDFFDFSLTPIVFSIRGLDVLRVLPVHSKLEFNWITDKVRYFYDGLKYQRQIGFYSLGGSLSHQLTKFLSSILNLWSYYPYDRRYHESTYINFGEDFPIVEDVLPGYPGMANKSRFDSLIMNVLSFRDLAHLFNVWWFWHPWLPKKGNFDFRSFYFSSLDFKTDAAFFFLVDLRYQFPSLMLKLKLYSFKFTVYFSSLLEGFYFLGNSAIVLKLLNFKHPVYSHLFDKFPSSFYYFLPVDLHLGVLKTFSINAVLVPKIISDLASFEFFGVTFSSNLSNKPVDSVLRFSTRFIDYNYSYGEFNLTSIINSHLFSPTNSRVMLISIYTIFELGGNFFSISGRNSEAEGLDLFSIQEKNKIMRFDDLFNFINTLFYFIVREYEDEFVAFTGNCLIGDDDDNNLRFLNRRVPLWVSFRVKTKLSKIPCFLFKYRYFSGFLQNLPVFNSAIPSLSSAYSKINMKPQYDNFFLTDSLLMSSPALALAYKRFLAESSY